MAYAVYKQSLVLGSCMYLRMYSDVKRCGVVNILINKYDTAENSSIRNFILHVLRNMDPVIHKYW